ncbi:acyl-CoA dehydrogenase [Alicycliphilus denitrificans]|uniref:acyl-CoA dehydrogenase family protein n=1 Tax=Alicycliphilus denitrificans TaxID=179636 RepID=UPI0019168D08|nr:acyl-CoA dehydrogenase family protein [Alicycliphilus denitrificans]MBN9575323.1 acyl-CoA/acyl-ACP dehydrogenase [Alicycliphilus denitrificans]BCN37064.1 acyl-CoA dehydrogenase [Alicycliphilus denitrificans]
MNDNLIQETVRRLLANEVSRELLTAVEDGAFASDLWSTMANAGMTKILCREEHGGIEASWLDALPLFFQVGYTQAPVPLAQAVVGQYFASRYGLDLPGESVFSLAAGLQTHGLSVALNTAGEPTTLTGQIKAVKWARHAHWLLAELNDRLVLVDIKGTGVHIEHGVDAASLPADTLVLQHAPVARALPVLIEDLPKPLQVTYAAVTAVQLTGALEYALDLAVQYAKDRVQFGKPIGKNQAIQQQLAALAGEVACSYAAATTALRDLPAISQNHAPQAEFSAAVAKVTASDAVKAGASIAHQVHGAIGFTYEYPLNFATRRLWAWRAEAGSSTEWAEWLGQAFVRGGSEQFWSHLTARTLPPGARQPTHQTAGQHINTERLVVHV